MTDKSQMGETPAAGRGDGATRRYVLAGVGLAGLAGAISACGSSGDTAGSGYGSGSGSGSSGGSGSGGGGALASTSDIPVGGGKVITASQIVVTQPEKGTFKGFSSVCTHMQCNVDQVANGTINCPCHGSKFSVKDGSVVTGPASSPLPAVNVSVSGTEIKKA